MIMKKYFNEGYLNRVDAIGQLLQLTCLTHDLDLLNSDFMDPLVRLGYVLRMHGGWNIITEKGISFLNAEGYIQPYPLKNKLT